MVVTGQKSGAGDSVSLLDENYGRAAVRLNRESELIADGILPERTIQERSAVVTGIVEALAECGSWHTALDMIRGPARLLYDNSRGRKEKLESLLASGVESAELIDPERRCVVVDAFQKAGYGGSFYRMGLRKDITPEAALSLLRLSEGVCSSDWVGAVECIAISNIAAMPSLSYSAYKMTGNNDGMNRCIDRAILNPVDNYNFLEKVVLESERGDLAVSADIVARMVQEIIPKHFSSPAMKDIGWRLFSLASKFIWSKLTDTQLKSLEDLAVGSLGEYEVVNNAAVPARIRLRWAKKHFEVSPGRAYAIFKAQKYSGEELFEAARCLWITEHPEKDVSGRHDQRFTNFSADELRYIYDRIPKKNVNQREFLAEKLGDNKELLRIGLAYSRKAGDDEDKNWRAYKLLAKSGLPFTDERVVKVRKRIVKSLMSSALKSGIAPPIWRIENQDVEGSEQLYEELIIDKKFPGTAYELATSRCWVDKIEAARIMILEKVSPEKSIRFFRDKNDSVGLQRALEKLSEETNVPVPELEKLVALKNL